MGKDILSVGGCIIFFLGVFTLVSGTLYSKGLLVILMGEFIGA